MSKLMMLAVALSVIALEMLLPGQAEAEPVNSTVLITSTVDLPEGQFHITGDASIVASGLGVLPVEYTASGTLTIEPYDPLAGLIWGKKVAWGVIRPALIGWLAGHFGNTSFDYQGQAQMDFGGGNVIQATWEMRPLDLDLLVMEGISTASANFNFDEVFGTGPFVLLPEFLTISDLDGPTGTATLFANISIVNENGELISGTITGTQIDALDPTRPVGLITAVSTMTVIDIAPRVVEFTVQAQAIPEPSTLTLVGVATLGGLYYGWRRRKRAGQAYPSTDCVRPISVGLSPCASTADVFA